MRSESTSRLTTIVWRAARYGCRALVVLVLIVGLLAAPPDALAQQRGKMKEAESGEAAKAYVLPYLIVIMLVGVGIMTVCRPGRRKDRADNKRRDDDED